MKWELQNVFSLPIGDEKKEMPLAGEKGYLLTHNKMLPGGIVNERQSRGAGIKYFL